MSLTIIKRKVSSYDIAFNTGKNNSLACILATIKYTANTGEQGVNFSLGLVVFNGG